MPKLALMTSGGDAPGMNAAIRAVVRKGLYEGFTIMGVRRGFTGLLSNDAFLPLEIGSVADTIHRGGTILLTARSKEFYETEYQDCAAARLHAEGVPNLIVIGGEGSFRGASELEKRGIRTVCIPATIDNDIGNTEASIGFDTALNTVLDAVNRLRDTATSHERIFVLEVMGRSTGHIALATGLAGGAESILVPEIEYDIDDVCSRLIKGIERRKAHSIIIVAEGAAGAFKVGEQIKAKTGLETRVTVLGHIQRGGTPSAVDRMLGSRMGAFAVDLLKQGESGLFTALKGEDITAVSLESAFESKKPFSEDLYELALVLAR